MTTIPVYGAMGYLTSVDGNPWRQQDWDTNKIIKTAKGKDINGRFELNIGGVKHVYTNADKEKFVPILMGNCCRWLQEQYQGPATLVPIPNSNALVRNKEDFRTNYLAGLMARYSKGRFTVAPCLRWIRPRDPAHKGGVPRDPQLHYENLQVIPPAPAIAGPLILFDDVMTTGSQIIASRRRLTEAGMNVVGAYVIGRTIKEQLGRMIQPFQIDIEVEFQIMDFGDLF